MRRAFSSWSIKKKLTFVAMGTAGTAIFIALLITSFLDVNYSRKWMEQQLSVLTEVVARNSVSAVMFDDAASAKNTLATLGVNHDIVYAEILTNSNKVLATYGIPDTLESFLNTQTISCTLEMKGEKYGTLRVIANLNDMWFSVFTQWVCTLTGLLFSVVISYVVLRRLSKYILEPIERLAHVTRDISQNKQYSLRVLKTSNDELGVLVDEFNDMLAQIEERDQKLLENRKQLEIELKRRTDEAVMEKAANSAKSQFLANMSHEIRTPMNGVLGMVELLLKTKLDEKQKRFANTVYRSAESLLGIINDILDFSKIEAGHLDLEIRDIDLKTLVTEAIELFSDKAALKSVKLNFKFSPDVPVGIRGDSLRLRQILINFLSNAIKFTEKGNIDIIVDLYEENKLRFIVKDTGIGISPEAMSRLFTAFNQADNSMTRRYGGTGLGLAIVKELVERMGGEITVDSIVGQGSVFTVILPLEKAWKPIVPSFAIQKENVRGQSDKILIGMKVLLVEDNPVNQEVGTAILNGLGCQVIVANNGVEAITVYQRENVDIILMDCQMPVMDGYAATAKIRAIEQASASGRRIPIIALTAHAMGGDREKCMTVGMDDYLSKPFKMAELAFMMKSCLENKQGDVIFEAIKSPSEPIVFDVEALEALKKVRPDGWEVLVSRILQLFHESVPSLIEEIKQGSETNNLDTIRRAAHSLKSSAANIGAMNMAAYCKEIEHQAAEAKLACDADVVNILAMKYQAIQHALADYVGSING